jgi:hypothetical protein
MLLPLSRKKLRSKGHISVYYTLAAARGQGLALARALGYGKICRFNGAWPSGKATVFGTVNPRFES